MQNGFNPADIASRYLEKLRPLPGPVQSVIIIEGMRYNQQVESSVLTRIHKQFEFFLHDEIFHVKIV